MARRKPTGALFLKKVGVWGFKAVKFSGYVELKPLTLFIGRNGSGKSSFVEALQWLQDSYIDGLSEATDERFRAYSYLLNKRSEETSLHLEFVSLPSGQPVYYDLTVGAASVGDRPIVTRESVKVGKTKGQKTILRSNRGSRGPVYRSIVEASRTGRWVSAEGNADRLGIVSLSRGHPALTSLADFVSRIVVVRLSPTMMRFESPMQRLGGRILDEEGARLPVLLDSLDAKAREQVRARVAEVLTGIRNIHVEMEHNRGFVSITERMRWPGRGGGKDVKLPSWMLSEGTRRLTALFALLAAKEKPSLLMIEEVENGLDPWTLEFVFQKLREHAQPGTQVILTTHSPFLLDHVETSEVIHVRRHDGESTYHPIGTYADVGKFEGTVAPGAMYISGYYDEKP